MEQKTQPTFCWAAITLFYLLQAEEKTIEKENADEMVGLIDARSPKVYKLMTANKRSDNSPIISAESWTEHLQSHFVQPQESVPVVLPRRSNSPTRHQLLSDQLRSGQVFLLTLQSHPALVAGTGAWTLPFNAAMSKHLYTSYPPNILWLPLSRKTFQTWTCSPAQVLIRSLLLSSSTQRKQFRMIMVRDTENVLLSLLTDLFHLFLSDGVTPHL